MLEDEACPEHCDLEAPVAARHHCLVLPRPAVVEDPRPRAIEAVPAQLEQGCDLVPVMALSGVHGVRGRQVPQMKKEQDQVFLLLENPF